MKVIALAFLLAALTASSSFAGRQGGVEEWYLYPSLQYFNWTESSVGRKILKEEGAFFGFGGGASVDLYRKSLILKIGGELFGSDARYRGETQSDTNAAVSERPLKTSVIYFGTKLESDIGWRVPLRAATLEPFAGIGYRWWLRALQDTTARDTAGVPFQVSGYSEVWHTVYTRLGIRGGFAAADNVNLFVEAGGKYPFLNRNIVDFPGVGTVTVQPDPRWSTFAEIGARYGNFRPSVFYEGFRFGQSPAVNIGGNRALLQPQSDSDIFGAKLGWAFR